MARPVQELQGGEAQGGTAGGVGFRQEVEDLVGAAVDQVEPFEGKGRPRTIADRAARGPPGRWPYLAGRRARARGLPSREPLDEGKRPDPPRLPL